MTTVPPDLAATARRVASMLISLAGELTEAAPEGAAEFAVRTLLVQAPVPGEVTLTGQQARDLQVALDEVAEKLALPFRWVAVSGGLSEPDERDWARNT